MNKSDILERYRSLSIHEKINARSWHYIYQPFEPEESVFEGGMMTAIEWNIRKNTQGYDLLVYDYRRLPAKHNPYISKPTLYELH
jgi:hypothetical protein